MTVTQAHAVFDLVDWLSRTPKYGGDLVTDDRAREALRTLADHASHRLQLTVSNARIDKAIAAHQAAESDGAAQVVCRAIKSHLAHGGSLPWPSVRRPYDDWLQAHEAWQGGGEAS
jgi:hypothetical protein